MMNGLPAPPALHVASGTDFPALHHLRRPGEAPGARTMADSVAGRNTIDFRASSGVQVFREPDAQTVKSAARVLEVFELFSVLRKPLCVREVSTQLGYPQSSTSVLLHCLQRLGYLTFDADSRTYLPSLRISALGDWIEEQFIPGTTLLRMMRAIQERLGETVVVGQQSGCFVQYVKVLLGWQQPQSVVRNGTFRPIATSALGRILLARKRDDDVRLLVRAMNADLKDVRLKVDEEALLIDLASVRSDGYARSHRPLSASRDLVAIELTTARHSVPLAVGVGGDTVRLDANLQEILQVLREEVARALL